MYERGHGVIVPYRTSSRAVASIVQLAADGVAADVRLLPSGTAAGAHVYSLRVASADVDVAGRLVGVRRDGAVDDLGGVAVASGSLGGARITIGATGRRAYVSIYLEIRGERIALRAEAPRLPPVRRSRALQRGMWCLGAGGAIGTAAFVLSIGAGTARPSAPPVTAPVAAAHISLVQPAPVVPPARIAALSARREWDRSGDVVTVAYLAVADSGNVTLVDPAGVPLRRAPFARDGVVRFAVPPSYRHSEVVARIAVRRGSSDAVASVALAAPADGAPSATAATPGVTTRGGAAAAGLVGVDGPAIAGRPIRVRVSALTRGGRLELQDAAGTTTDAADVTPGATHVTLRLPPGAATAFLVTRYDRNGAEETIVQPIVVRPG